MVGRTVGKDKFLKIITRKEAIEQGLKRYFTGKPCRYGHVDERTLCNGRCRTCGREQRRILIRENPEKENQRVRKYRESEKGKKRYERYKIANADKIKKQSAGYYRQPDVLLMKRLYTKARVERIADSYVTGLLRKQTGGIPSELITPETIGLKRTQLQIKRYLKEENHV